MKKVLIAVLCVCALAGCGKDSKTIQSSSAPVGQYTMVQTEFQENNDVEEKNVTNEEVDVPKSEQIGTAGSNIPLKDNNEEAEKQIIIAFQKWIENAYGENVVESNITVEKIYSAEEEAEDETLKDYNLGMNEIAFEVKYELKPAPEADVNMLMAANGELDEESGWVKEKYNLGILRPSESEDGTYVVTNVGTGW